MRSLALILCICSIATAQSILDSPSTIRGVAATQGDTGNARAQLRESACGPHWLGGCWSPDRISSWHDTFHDKKWWIPTVTFLGATAFDYALTVRGTDRRWADGTPVCVEGNTDLPLNPGPGDVAADFAKTHVPVIVMGTLIHKVTRKSRWASWIYPGMMAYGTQMHIRAGAGWFSCH